MKASPLGLSNINIADLAGYSKKTIRKICLIYINIKTYEKNNIPVKYYELTEKEKNSITEVIWSSIEAVLQYYIQSLFDKYITKDDLLICEYFSDLILPKLLRCINEGINEDCLEIDRVFIIIYRLLQQYIL